MEGIPGAAQILNNALGTLQGLFSIGHLQERSPGPSNCLQALQLLRVLLLKSLLLTEFREHAEFGHIVVLQLVQCCFQELLGQAEVHLICLEQSPQFVALALNFPGVSPQLSILLFHGLDFPLHKANRRLHGLGLSLLFCQALLILGTLLVDGGLVLSVRLLQMPFELVSLRGQRREGLRNCTARRRRFLPPGSLKQACFASVLDGFLPQALDVDSEGSSLLLEFTVHLLQVRQGINELTVGVLQLLQPRSEHGALVGQQSSLLLLLCHLLLEHVLQGSQALAVLGVQGLDTCPHLVQHVCWRIQELWQPHQFHGPDGLQLLEACVMGALLGVLSREPPEYLQPGALGIVQLLESLIRKVLS
mmetsp:Transcript_24356/g.54275  ORF Transcript_24356/g.54275 Transcript_24356/m.54275 type:complete len:362 (+) Transcript_24356:1569-2654(+)